MPNTSTPRGSRYTGLFRDMVNGTVELYYLGTLIKTYNATTETSPSSLTINVDGPVDFDNTVNIQGGTASPNLKRKVVNLGSAAAVASNGAAALITDIKFVAPADMVITGAWRVNQTASDVTAGTSISSASYRRVTLITNTAGTGSGTNIVASQNATASAASNASRAFTTVASTVPAGAIIMASHVTVGADTADGTDLAASVLTMEYELV